MTAFPLTAIVGQEELVEALLINAVAPDVGGVLVRGERGTAKSTAVRGLAPLLPPVVAAAGQAYAFAPGDLAPGGPVALDADLEDRAAPLVELPIGATLDRLVGALDLGRALAGEHAFEAGLLARAHQGILYVDEVNLLPDHLVDALLDAAAAGVARVERESVSVEHAARFVLVGTMNVEEGDLRPQLLDRFGLGVEVRAPGDPAQRAEIVRRRLAFEADPAGFASSYRDSDAALAARIAAARARLPHVRLPERELMRITGACAQLGVDGVRGDIVTARAARVLAAFDGTDEVTEAHVRRAATLALAHRRRRDPLASGSDDHDSELDRALGDDPDDDPPPPNGNGRAQERGQSPFLHPGPSAESEAGDAGAMQERGQATSRNSPSPERRDVPVPAVLPRAALALPGSGEGPAGRRARGSGQGAGSIDSRPASGADADVAVVATLRARLLGDDEVHEHVRAGRESTLICLVVDASGSMGARRRLAHVKGALIGLLRDAYARRDRVALVAFAGEQARTVVEPGAPLERAATAIRELPTGGRTPLAAGLDEATRLLQRETAREPRRRAIAVVLTDGRVEDPNRAIPAAAARLARAAAAVHVVDTESGPVRLRMAAELAGHAAAHLHTLQIDTRRAA